MFSVSTSNKSGFDLIVLTDTLSNSQVEISPSCGGILHGFFFYKTGRHYNVISSYNSKDDFIEKPSYEQDTTFGKSGENEYTTFGKSGENEYTNFEKSGEK
jgi:hypothetical protein